MIRTEEPGTNWDGTPYKPPWSLKESVAVRPDEALPTLDDVLTHRELADFLGVSERSLHAYRIPRIALGKQRLYFRGDVVRWLLDRGSSQTRQTV